MEPYELRAIQAPLKKKYKEEALAALVKVDARAVLASHEIECEVDTWGGRSVTAGLHSATGGDGSKACSADMLLESLVACAGVTLKSVATAMGIKLSFAEVRAEGIWDARGTLGLDSNISVGLTKIELKFNVMSDSDPCSIKKLIELTERYCVIYQTLKGNVDVSAHFLNSK